MRSLSAVLIPALCSGSFSWFFADRLGRALTGFERTIGRLKRFVCILVCVARFALCVLLAHGTRQGLYPVSYVNWWCSLADGCVFFCDLSKTENTSEKMSCKTSSPIERLSIWKFQFLRPFACDSMLNIECWVFINKRWEAWESHDDVLKSESTTVPAGFGNL